MHDGAGDHLVTCGYLVLDVYAGGGDGSRRWGGHPFHAFAVGLLDGKQRGVVDEVGGQRLIHCVQIPLDSCLHKTADQSLVLFGVRHRSVLLLNNARVSNDSTPRMMPPDSLLSEGAVWVG